MSELKRRAWRNAARMHETYVRARQEESAPVLPERTWRECAQSVRLLTLALSRGWSGAVREQRSSLWGAFHRLQNRCIAILQDLSEEPPDANVPSLRQLYDELLALHQEFPNYEIDLKQRTLTVETEDIELEGVPLGAFQIVLFWDHLDEPPSYEVLARDATASSSKPVHPHVNERHLCEGDGKLSIRRALAEGRLCDFFQIVDRVLHTYNESSAYVSLSDWDGRRCDACGGSTSDDEVYGCQRCGDWNCAGCSVRCAGCQEDCCSDCLTTCPGCDDNFCRNCLQPCSQCEGDYCDDCLTEGRCARCRASSQTPADDEEPDATPPTTVDDARPGRDIPATVAAIHSHRVGQAALPARPRRH